MLFGPHLSLPLSLSSPKCVEGEKKKPNVAGPMAGVFFYKWRWQRLTCLPDRVMFFFSCFRRLSRITEVTCFEKRNWREPAEAEGETSLTKKQRVCCVGCSHRLDLKLSGKPAVGESDSGRSLFSKVRQPVESCWNLIGFWCSLCALLRLLYTHFFFT